MKNKELWSAVGEIDDDLIENADRPVKKKEFGTVWIRWGTLAAALVLIIALGVFVLPGMFKGNAPQTPDKTLVNNEGGAGVGDPSYTGSELYLYEWYDYSVDSGEFASYVKGRVIPDGKVGAKITEVTVTAGWVRPEQYEQSEKEHARAEIYEIKGISKEVAVAIRFIDKLEAQLTDCYYVIMNPDADLTPVESYVITFDPYAPGDNDGAE